MATAYVADMLHLFKREIEASCSDILNGAYLKMRAMLHLATLRAIVDIVAILAKPAHFRVPLSSSNAQIDLCKFHSF